MMACCHLWDFTQMVAFSSFLSITEVMTGSSVGLRGKRKDHGIASGGLSCSLYLGLGQPGAFLSSLSLCQLLTEPESLLPHWDGGDK